MIWTADCVVHEGRAKRGMGLEVGDDGRILQLAPLEQLGAADACLTGRAILPGRIDPYHQSLSWAAAPALAHDPAPTTLPERLWGASERLVSQLTPQDYFVLARAAFLRLLSRGITCVGEAFGLHGRAGLPSGSMPWAMLDALLAAAEAAGIRLAVVDTVRLPQARPSPEVVQQAGPPPFVRPAQPAWSLDSPHIEHACQSFDALVGRLLRRRNPNLSWALAVHSMQTVTYPDLVSLKVRLGHMPLLLPRPSPSAAWAHAVPGHRRLPLVALWEHELLDAGVSILTDTPLHDTELAALRAAGCPLLVCPPAAHDAGWPQALWQQARGSDLQYAVASAGGDPARLPAMHPTDPTTAAHMARSAACSLGVDTGSLSPGRWADFVTVPMPDNAWAEPRAQHARPTGAAAQPGAQALLAARLVAQLFGGGGGGQVADVVVGGRWVLRGNVNPADACRATDSPRGRQPHS